MFELMSNVALFVCGIFFIYNLVCIIAQYIKDLIKGKQSFSVIDFIVSFVTLPFWIVMPIMGFIMQVLPVFLYIMFSFGLPYTILTEFFNMEDLQSTYISILIFSIASIIIAYFIVKSRLSEKFKKKEEELEQEYKAKEEELENKNIKLDQLMIDCNKRQEKLREVLKDSNPFKLCALMQSDAETLIFEEDILYRVARTRMQYSTAQELRKKINEKTKEYYAMYKEMLYKYEALINTFPILKEYVDDEQSLLDFISCGILEDGSADDYDRARDYLSPEEYRKLTPIERNQRALDIYMSRPKSAWTIGMLYEMYCGHELRRQGFKVVQHGIEKGKGDLGRDILAYKGMDTYVIQCKCWSKDKEIHENVICQLYGTSIEYQLSEELCTLLHGNAYPVLITTAKLSPMASKFAKQLGVRVVTWQISKFPLIKCNINNGEKIYHLPFDQQYWRTNIDKPGEFYAMTVAEAEAAGFRRAFRHLMSKNN